MLLLALLAPAWAVDLDVSGACPGPMALTFTDLTPGARYALLSASGPGVGTAVPGGPCRGSPLGLAGGDLTLRVSGADDGDGFVFLEPSLPLEACGLSVQAIDLVTCETSEVRPFVGVGGSELYMAASSGGVSGLWRLDTETGETAFVGDPGVPLTGLTFDDAGALFGVEGGRGSGAVLELDPATGAVLRTVADLGLREAAIGWRGGRLWVADQYTDLRFVDRDTGAVGGPGWGTNVGITRWGYALAGSVASLVYINDRTVHQVDPVTGDLSQMVTVRGVDGDGGGASFHNNELWFATDDGAGGTALYIVSLVSGVAAPTGFGLDEPSIDALASPTP
ncbi:MAG: hypothetical protein ACI9K2_005249 [Myxococcota bacterium]|jgi:hypothetical protein